MPEFEKEEFKFPHEEKDEKVVKDQEEEKFEIEVEDDVPSQDRGREPAPKELVDELEQDELEDYSEKVKIKLKQLKRVWHDERRAKEAVERERQEAFSIAQKLLEENKSLKNRTFEYDKQSADRDLADARQQYKDAYEAGDSERLIEAESKFCNGQIDVAKFVAQVAANDLFQQRLWLMTPMAAASAAHVALLGRAPEAAEATAFLSGRAQMGQVKAIEAVLNSASYKTSFGANTVPYLKGLGSQPGMALSSLVRTATLYGGNGGLTPAIQPN